MKPLLKDLKPHRKEVILAPLFKMLEAAFELFVPLVMKRIMDVYIPEGNTQGILLMAVVLIALAVVGLVSSVTAQYFSAKAATGYAATLRSRIFRRVQALSFSGLDEAGTSTIITRMTSDVNQIQNGLNLTLRLFLRSPFIVIGAVIMAFVVNPGLAWIFVVAVPLLALVVVGIMAVTMPLYRKVQGALDGVTLKTRENLTGVRTIRAFRLEKTETEVFLENNALLKGLQKFVGRISAFLNPVTYVIVNLSIVVILLLGGRAVAFGVITAGTVIALVNYMSQILVELIKLANLIVQMTRALASLHRVEEILSPREDDEWATLETGEKAAAGSLAASDDDAADAKEPDVVDAPGGADRVPSVRFKRVSMRYGTSAGESLSDISFTAYPGETIGVIGGTGSGKTTLVSLIPGFYPASEGEVLVDGKPVSAYTENELRRKVGIVMQKTVLFQGTVRENVQMGKENASDEEVWQALESAQAADFVREKEGGLDASVEQEGRNFSGGQKQRLSIARALVKKPEILILDDSASALDFATDAALRQAIRAMAGERTVFIVSQRTASVMNADRILVLEDGRLIGQGTHAELLVKCPVYKEIYDSQFH